MDVPVSSKDIRSSIQSAVSDFGSSISQNWAHLLGSPTHSPHCGVKGEGDNRISWCWRGRSQGVKTVELWESHTHRQISTRGVEIGWRAKGAWWRKQGKCLCARLRIESNRVWHVLSRLPPFNCSVSDRPVADESESDEGDTLAWSHPKCDPQALLLERGRFNQTSARYLIRW